MKKYIQCIVSGLLVCALTGLPALATSSFPDVDEHAVYVEAVEFLNSVGIMQGDTQGNFNSDKAVTRAEMAAIICRMLGEAEDSASKILFVDVPASYWASGYITKAAELGIVNGYSDGYFHPEDTVTYEQAVTMMVRAVDLESAANAAGGYPDGFISIASEEGYLDNISAQVGDQMMRWQIAVICYNVMIGGEGQ